jgi:hypothetical protein
VKKRKDGLCPLTPKETALALRAFDIDRNIQVCIAAGEINKAERRMAALKEAFPNMLSTLIETTSKIDIYRFSYILAFNVADYVHVGTCRISPDHNFLAYTLDITGSERFMLQIKDLRNGCIIPKLRVDGVVSLAWAQDGNTLFYTISDDNQRPYRQGYCSGSFCLGFTILSYLFFLPIWAGFSVPN